MRRSSLRIVDELIRPPTTLALPDKKEFRFYRPQIKKKKKNPFLSREYFSFLESRRDFLKLFSGMCHSRERKFWDSTFFTSKGISNNNNNIQELKEIHPHSIGAGEFRPLEGTTYLRDDLAGKRERKDFGEIVVLGKEGRRAKIETQ